MNILSESGILLTDVNYPEIKDDQDVLQKIKENEKEIQEAIKILESILKNK